MLGVASTAMYLLLLGERHECQRLHGLILQNSSKLLILHVLGDLPNNTWGHLVGQSREKLTYKWLGERVQHRPCCLWYKVLTSPLGRSGTRPACTLAWRGMEGERSHSPHWTVHGAWTRKNQTLRGVIKSHKKSNELTTCVINSVYTVLHIILQMAEKNFKKWQQKKKRVSWQYTTKLMNMYLHITLGPCWHVPVMFIAQTGSVG